jgi:hypothetical protein
MSSGSRKASDIRRGQYEFPAFAAGVVAALMLGAIRLIGLSVQRRGGDALLEEAVKRLGQACGEVRGWQRMAAMVTDYDAAREEVERDG